MALTVHYKNYPDRCTPYLFVASSQDASLFSTGDFESLPALSEISYEIFLSSYNDLIAKLWQANKKNPSFGFLPLALRNTWQSSYYQGAESYARLSGLSDAIVYFTSPHWFLWTIQNLVCDASLQDVAQAQKDARKSFLRRFVSRLRGVYFALSQASVPRPAPTKIRSCFFSIWTVAGLRKWAERSLDPFYAALPEGVEGSALVYHLEGVLSPGFDQPTVLPVSRDTSLIRLEDWISIIVRTLLFRSCVPSDMAGPREAMLEDMASSASNQLVLALISYYAARNIASANPGLKFVTLYEGNCWEQGVLQAAIEHQCQVVGLQHTAFSPGMLKMRADTQGNLPSHIITSGPVASDLLKQHMAHKSVNLFTGFRVRNDSGQIPFLSGRGMKILVLLQGSPCDGLMLFQLSRISLPYDVKVRCHPSQPYKKTKNFEIAHGSLEENLQETAIVLYNGTTTAFDALLAGVPCIYVSCGDNGRYDPLFDLECRIKGNCYDIWALPEMIEEMMILSPEGRKEAFEKAHSYIEGYFRPPTPESERALIEYLKND